MVQFLEHCNQRCTIITEPCKDRYQIPAEFETSVKSLTQSDVCGKQLWLIRTPRDFKIEWLNEKTVNLAGSSFITVDNEQKSQFQVTAEGSSSSQISQYCSMVASDDAKEVLKVGPAIHGQIHIKNWVLEMEPVSFIKSPPKKHIVPDYLQPKYVPFGSKSPERFTDVDEIDSAKKKHKKKKKRKEKVENDLLCASSKKRKHNLDLSNIDGDGVQVKRSKKHSVDNADIRDVDHTINSDVTADIQDVSMLNESDMVSSKSHRKKKKRKKNETSY